MQYSVIFDVDTTEDNDPVRYKPQHGEWQCTESVDGKDDFELSYLGGSWENGHHRKWAALLDEKDFEAWMSESGLVFEDIETMGMIGAPGFGFGWAPAFSFRLEGEYDAIGGAYVCPVPDGDPPNTEAEQDAVWNDFKAKLKAKYS